MTVSSLMPPSQVSHIAVIVDWLELTVVFDEFQNARTDSVLASLEAQEETPEDIIHEKDRTKDLILESIENEIELRESRCGEAYPFYLSDDGEELKLRGALDDTENSYYLVCLLASHLTKSELLSFDIPQKIVTTLRNRVFQIVSTLGMAGLALGPSLSIGWPRDDETILEALARAQDLNAGVHPRKEASPLHNPDDKDGGIDVIAWRFTHDEPPENFWFGQVASGHNWKDKSARNEADSFKEKYIGTGPLGNVDYATLIPFRVIEDFEWLKEHRDHRAIQDRTRLPQRALEGARLVDKGIQVDEVENVSALTKWIADFREAALA